MTPTPEQRQPATPRTAANLFCEQCGHEPHDERDDPRCPEIIAANWTAEGADPEYCGCTDVDALYVRMKQAEAASPSAGLRAALERLLESKQVAPPVVADHEWPARCWDCGFTTEDPDAYHGDDEDLMPEGRLCPETGTFHRWVPAGTVRYIPADTLAVFRAALAPAQSGDAGKVREQEWYAILTELEGEG